MLSMAVVVSRWIRCWQQTVIHTKQTAAESSNTTRQHLSRRNRRFLLTSKLADWWQQPTLKPRQTPTFKSNLKIRVCTPIKTKCRAIWCCWQLCKALMESIPNSLLLANQRAASSSSSSSSAKDPTLLLASSIGLKINTKTKSLASATTISKTANRIWQLQLSI